GLFAPAGHYQGKYFSGEQIKEESLLKPKEVRALESVAERMRTPQETQALKDLIAHRKLTGREQDNLLRSVARIEGFDALAKSALDKANKAAWHDSKIIRAYRDWIAWLFGLIGLGMQITTKALKQAGGTPLIIGGIVGTLKAVGSLVVVLLFVREYV
ncbi:putative sulfate exporter family transporter, partial [bacterium]|nr:putative sulfate exporter family transporter [bacterium]